MAPRLIITDHVRASAQCEHMLRPSAQCTHQTNERCAECGAALCAQHVNRHTRRNHPGSA